jgi:tetratricopeptide (TPR) repeat protein
VALHQLLVSFLNVPAVLFAVAIPVAMLDASATRPFSVSSAARGHLRRGGGLAWSTGTATLFLALLFAWWTTPATTMASYAARAVDAGNWAQADVLAQQARSLDPTLEHYRFLDGLAAAHQGDDARAAEDLASFAAFTDLPEAWVNLAELRLRASNVPGAIDAIQRASRLGLQHPADAVAIADLALRAKDPETAIRAGAEALARAPSLAGDPWWYLDPDRAKIFPGVLARALEVGGPDRRWEILLMAGMGDGALSALAGAPDQPLAKAVVEAWGGDASAAAQVFGRCDAEPLEGPIAWCARIASRLGNQMEALRYRRLATMLHTDPNTTHELRIVPVLSRPSSAGDVTYKASGLSERNLSLWDVLIPGIPRIDLVDW